MLLFINEIIKKQQAITKQSNTTKSTNHVSSLTASFANTPMGEAAVVTPCPSVPSILSGRLLCVLGPPGGTRECDIAGGDWAGGGSCELAIRATSSWVANELRDVKPGSREGEGDGVEALPTTMKSTCSRVSCAICRSKSSRSACASPRRIRAVATEAASAACCATCEMVAVSSAESILDMHTRKRVTNCPLLARYLGAASLGWGTSLGP